MAKFGSHRNKSFPLSNLFVILSSTGIFEGHLNISKSTCSTIPNSVISKELQCRFYIVILLLPYGHFKIMQILMGSIELFIIIAAGSSIFSWSLPFSFWGCWGCRAQPLYSWHSDLIVLCVYLLWPHLNILLYMQKSRLALHNFVKSVVLYKVCGRTLHLANAIIIFYYPQSSFPLSNVNFDFKTWVTNI